MLKGGRKVSWGWGEKSLVFSPTAQNLKMQKLEIRLTKSVHSILPSISTIAIMKRKLDVDDIPTAVDRKDGFKKPTSFNALALDSRLLQAVAQQNFSAPTLVQSRAIPLALEGKDILGSRIMNLKESLAD